jgi:hypothetical protein
MIDQQHIKLLRCLGFQRKDGFIAWTHPQAGTTRAELLQWLKLHCSLKCLAAMFFGQIEQPTQR